MSHDKKRKLLFPAALWGIVLLCLAMDLSAGPVARRNSEPADRKRPVLDTVIYPKDAYKSRSRGQMEEFKIADSLLTADDSLSWDNFAEDTLVLLTARDTVKVPDSLKLTDPWRWRYYVALVDSLTHRQTADSLQREGDSLMMRYNSVCDSIAEDTPDFRAVYDSIYNGSRVDEEMAVDTFRAEAELVPASGDTLRTADTLSWRPAYVRALGDSTLAAFDFAERAKLDSVYRADSTARAKAAFLEWYNSLTPEARKKYDFEQKELRKLAVRDSLDEIKAEKRAVRDSIRKNTPRILETYAIPDSMFYKRIIAWNEDRDFGQINPYVPDTSYNYHFYDYPFLREDVNATWLGTSGSPVQSYNFFNRKSDGVSFYDAYSTWTFTPETFNQYNTKTPYTELAYYGTLLAGDAKESDNIHIFTTQNITPALNFSLLYDAWNAGGMLINEQVKNKTAAVGVNYLGKRYSANAGIIHNKVTMGENGGILDISEIRDTTIELREVRVAMESATSTTDKFTAYADQQLSIPFTFINDWRSRRDSTFVADSSDAVTTAYIGNALEYSRYGRKFVNGAATDSLGQTRVDAKFYLRLQPWSEDSFISKLDVGVGDYVHSYHNVLAADTTRLYENSLYLYAGARGNIGEHSHWNAKAHSVFAGADAGNTDLSAQLTADFFPFRKARKSPVSMALSFSESLLNPTFYQRHMYSTANELYRWDMDYRKQSITKAEASLKIPYTGTEARAGYALLGNYCYYDTLGLARQHTAEAFSVFSAYLRQEFVIADFLHLDNRILYQKSGNPDVLPLPELSLNLKYFIQFPVQKGVMDMQIGVNAWWNTKWYSPQWNYITGTFNNQNEWQYNNGPHFDVFVNMQWKNATIFVKLQNAGAGWPMDHADYFSAHRYIVTGNGTTGLKFGIWWPFYLSPVQNRQVSR